MFGKEEKTRRSFFVDLMSSAAGLWVVATGLGACSDTTVKYGGPPQTDGMNAAKYGGPTPDGGAKPDAPVAKYGGQLRDSAPAVKYGGQFRDAGPVVKYGGAPSDGSVAKG